MRLIGCDIFVCLYVLFFVPFPYSRPQAAEEKRKEKAVLTHVLLQCLLIVVATNGY